MTWKKQKLQKIQVYNPQNSSIHYASCSATKVVPRFVGVVAAFLWGGGFIVGSIGISTHQLWLLYLGYGVLGGFGLGHGYDG